MLGKIRTFTLKLMSDFERLESRHDVQLDTIKACISDYWNTFVVSSEATFESYSALLKSLEPCLASSDAVFRQEAKNILSNHQGLIELQTVLSSDEQGLSEKIANLDLESEALSKLHYQHLLDLGLLEANARQVHFNAKKKGLPFNINVPLPQMQTLFNRYAIVDFAHRVKPEFREAADWLLEHLQLITLKELCMSIKSSCEQLSNTVSQYDGYHILTVSDKSQAWMANLAMRFLPADKLPESVLAVGREGGIRQQFGQIVEAMSNADYNNFILFDDVSYSGTQLMQTLFAIGNQLHEGIKRFESPTQLDIVLGCMSKQALARVHDYLNDDSFNLMEKYNLSVRVHCEHIYDDIQTLFEKEKTSLTLQIKVLQLCENATTEIQKQRLLENIEKFNKTTTVTQWKTPDGFSTPYCLTQGTTYLYRFNESDLRLSSRVRPTHPFAEPIVNQIVPPYRNKGKSFGFLKM